MKIKLIIKGVLLYVTTFIVILWICGIDSIYDNGYFIYSIFIVIALVYTCYKTISMEEFEILTFDKFFNNKENHEV